MEVGGSGRLLLAPVRKDLLSLLSIRPTCDDSMSPSQM